jgi:UDPglucose 6-dehydrogenase
MVITVFGLGFVGLTTALGLAEKGIKVYGVESNSERAGEISGGKVPFYEPGLDDALTRLLSNGFSVTSDISSAVIESDCVFYCVGTPYGERGEADLTYLFTAITDTLNAINDDKLRVLVTKSTVPPSTTSERIIPYVKSKKRAGSRIGIANNPEFLREGYCWDDFINADRIVIGVDGEDTERVLRELYSGFDVPVFAVSLNTAEYIKYLSNTLLATMISFSNEMAGVAHEIGCIDIPKAFKILHLDKRWGNCNMTSYVYPGCGYGGYCLPKDTNALYKMMKLRGFDMPILGAAITTNNNISDTVCDRITEGLNKSTHLGILGLSFKPGSDDVRDTPAAGIIKGLLERGFTNISAYDPIATENFCSQFNVPIEYMLSMDEIGNKADVLIILTAWDEFKSAEKYGKKVIDCRYMQNN